jgi:glucans biosynthesis protein
VDAVLWVDANGQVLERQLTRNEVTGGWRFVVRLRRVDGGKPVELRAHLGHGNEVLSETWSYVLPPD